MTTTGQGRAAGLAAVDSQLPAGQKTSRRPGPALTIRS